MSGQMLNLAPVVLCACSPHPTAAAFRCRLTGMNFMKIAVALLMTTAVFAADLDFETYRSQVEPIFLKKRPGHARCIVCHEANSSAFHLEALAPGATAWTEEQSRRNFANVSRLVVPGNPAASKLLLHPLSPDAGGDYFHSGGRQFASKQDAEWKTIAAWVSAAK
jgi:hypothetical protein